MKQPTLADVRHLLIVAESEIGHDHQAVCQFTFTALGFLDVVESNSRKRAYHEE